MFAADLAMTAAGVFATGGWLVIKKIAEALLGLADLANNVYKATGACDCDNWVGCKPPASGWCTHSGAKKVSKDCDGDGNDDWLCTDYGNKWLIQSKEDCSMHSYPGQGHKGGSDVEVCPDMTIDKSSGCGKPDPKWCTHVGATQVSKDCDGDGIPDVRMEES